MTDRPLAMLVALFVASSVFGIASVADAFDRLERLFEGAEEQLVVFPTYARLDDDGSLSIPVRAWTYEPERDSRTRAMIVSTLEETLDIEDESESERFERRIQPFLFDNERGKRIVMQLAGEEYVLGTTAPNGHVTARLEVSREVAARALQTDGDQRWLEPTFAAEFGSIERRIPLIEREGRTVVSDIDDTVKVTEVLDREEMLRNTFLREFEAVDGMAPLLQKLAPGPHDRVHYLSASPWQLYPFLASFLHDAGFPDGLFHLRQLRPKSISSPLDFVEGSSAYKTSTIARLLSDFPKRTFVLVGDSGEHDPEVYGKIARNHPDRIERILIREVDGAKNADERFAKALEGVADSTWETFEEPASIEGGPPTTNRSE